MHFEWNEEHESKLRMEEEEDDDADHLADTKHVAFVEEWDGEGSFVGSKSSKNKKSKWYGLTPKERILKNLDPVKDLDVSILSNHLLDPILGITDLRTDNRIYFKGRLEGVEALIDDVDSGKAKAAFAHYPVSMKQLKKIADADEIMPPKSTWIEPKLRSGLTVFSTNEAHK